MSCAQGNGALDTAFPGCSSSFSCSSCSSSCSSQWQPVAEKIPLRAAVVLAAQGYHLP